MLLMLRRYLKIRIQVENVLNKLKEKCSKKKKQKIQGFYLSEDEKDKLTEVVAALQIVNIGSQLLCGNEVTLPAADRVSTSLARCNSSYTYPYMNYIANIDNC